MLAALLATMLRLPFTVLGLLLAVVAIVVGIRMLIAARGTGRVQPLVIGALAMSGFVVVTSGASIAAWPAQMALQECQDRAVTNTARAQCEATFTENLFDAVRVG
ncbi:hypothetical protein [Litorihabitans aurantiacus]|uniref:Uncharacterized protein n=1 Tax=Litorihabitans aurantiacus TaxID=1930061 RepID=A0AA38CTK3_9MICO|nr:hypothetical protein [Litorihabitans aurantiacus]GMA32199.1 hypothetical protein GCM10025875_21910 [Litorihabitans aurantiacus]